MVCAQVNRDDLAAVDTAHHCARVAGAGNVEGVAAQIEQARRRARRVRNPAQLRVPKQCLVHCDDRLRQAAQRVGVELSASRLEPAGDLVARPASHPLPVLSMPVEDAQ